MSQFKMSKWALVCSLILVTVLASGCQCNQHETSGIIGPDGGIVDSTAGASVEIPQGALNQEVVVDVADTSDAEVRQTLAVEVPYAGALTIDATAASEIPPGPVDAASLAMIVTVPLESALPEGTELDVYLRGEMEGQWIRLDVKAVVNSGGLSASFETNRIGTFILREPDEYSILTIDYDSPEKAANPYFIPTLGFGLHSVNANPSINKTPIILIHGAGSHENSEGVNSTGGVYARWDNFITWAQNGGVDLNTFELWWFLHNSYLPVGFDPQAQYPVATENNAQQLADAIAANRAAGKFPGPEHQFIIIAHSRGGLVARTFVEKLPGAADEVMAAITLATPHHGSPMAVPDWSFKTLADNFSLPSIIEPVVGVIPQLAVWQNIAWWLPGCADLAWDNFDGTAPYPYGVPPDGWVTLNTWLNGILTPLHQLTTNDAGWPTNAAVSDSTMPLPDIYVLANGTTHGRKAGNTLWNLNHDPQADTYINKFILYAGYIGDPLLKSEWLDHRGLQILNPMMLWYESAEQDVSHFAANDGMVPVQSALYLEASQDEPIYATQTPWWNLGRERPKEPIELDIPAIEARLKLANKSHCRLFENLDHFDMVAGKGNLFSTIAADLNNTYKSMPTAVIVDPLSVNGLQVTLNASGSHDNSTAFWPAITLKYRVDWDASDGLNWSAWGTSASMTHPYASAGTYTVSLQVRDQDGMLSAIDTAPVTVGTGGEGEGEYVSDDFEDGSIDSAKWLTGGWHVGVEGPGSGTYTWSHEEIAATDGYLQVRVQGPTSGNSYGATAWLRTKYDFNDGKDHVINFRWGADVNAYHVDHYAISIVSAFTETQDAFWLQVPSADFTNLYFAGSGAIPMYDIGQVDMPGTHWSIAIDAQENSATLYLGPDLSGIRHAERRLDPAKPWYVAFETVDATSSGFPATDNSLFLYSFSERPTLSKDLLLVAQSSGALDFLDVRSGAQIRSVTLDNSPVQWVQAADVTGDGVCDILTVPYNVADKPARAISLASGQTLWDTQYPASSTSRSENIGFGSVWPGDFDYDGTTEVVMTYDNAVGGPFKQVFSGNDGTRESVLPLEAGSQSYSVYLDTTRSPSYRLVTCDTTQGGFTHWMRNYDLTNANALKWTNTAVNTWPITSVGASNCDGLPRMWGGWYGRTLYVVDSEGGTKWSAGFGGSYEASAAYVGDLFGDGTDTILIGGTYDRGHVRLDAVNLANGNVRWTFDDSDADWSVHTMAWKDVTGDGVKDVFIWTGGYEGNGIQPKYQALNGTNGSRLWQVEYAYSAFLPQHCRITDVDADGDPEVLLVVDNTIEARDGLTGALVKTYTFGSQVNAFDLAFEAY